MPETSKRTYRLTERAQSRVRELAGRYSIAGSQDSVVELAVDRLYRDVTAAAEAREWAAAAEDPEFRAEVDQIAHEFADAETWPEG
jgi:hypothetical protein